MSFATASDSVSVFSCDSLADATAPCTDTGDKKRVATSVATESELTIILSPRDLSYSIDVSIADRRAAGEGMGLVF